MMSDRPGIELNTVQLVASMAAAVTGAVLTSYIGDGGTILGTAVGSGASTAGFAVYKHYLARTKDKVAPVIVEHARQWTPTGTVTSDHNATRSDAAGQAGGADMTRVDRAPGYQNGNGYNGPPANCQAATGQGTGAADWDRARRTAPGWAEPTRAEQDWGPGVTRQDHFSPDETRQDVNPTRQDAAPTRTARYDGTGYDGPAHYGTVQMGTGSDGGAGSGDAGSGGPSSGKHGKSRRGGGFLSGRPRWVVMTASAAAVFIVVMIGITLVELGTGKPIDASVWNRSQSGTTLGGSHRPSTTPSTTPTPSATAPGSTGPSSGVQSSANPTTAPTPTPSSVPTVGSTPTANTPASGRASAPVPGQ
jgi:hypothetical protein